MLVEAGHRCAIHTCRQVPVELAHITPWSKCREHTFGNLIALCPTYHTRFDREDIDRQAMMTYKHKLRMLAGPFSIFEHRLLMALAQRPERDGIWLLADLELLFADLLANGYLVDTGQGKPLDNAGEVLRKMYQLTSKGREYLESFDV